ncbi:MAG TPA: 3-methyl-2-oxobutanoate hydroxymethyltransferase [Candidatus Kapabacteria bacterium]|nr:3-methyl-2-oxobutanoate hydroxymethyltransferase [Candidatus Kapabacteria bacterium]
MRVTTRTIAEKKQRGEKITMLTAYDYTFAKLLDEAEIDLLLVGDSVSNVVQGNDTTLPVTLDEMIYHSKAVIKGARNYSMVVCDLPFMTYQADPVEGFRNAGRVMKETGAGAVKLEGGERVCETVKLMTDNGIPVCGHLGLTPQSINQFGTYRTRGTNPEEADRLKKDALALQDAGVFAIVLEKIPAALAEEVTKMLQCATIGIGAGNGCDGQVLVLHDMLGLNEEFHPRFVRKYLHLAEEVRSAFKRYSEDVRSGGFPNKDESY